MLEVRDLTVTFPSEAGPSPPCGVSTSTSPAVKWSAWSANRVPASRRSRSASWACCRNQHGSEGLRASGRRTHRAGRSRPQPDPRQEHRMVFQDPLSAFTPVYTIGGRSLKRFGCIATSAASRRWRCRSNSSTSSASRSPMCGSMRSPTSFSGGMRQRAMIAMAVANAPT